MIKGLDYRLNNPELEGARTETDKASTEKKAKKRPQDANIKNPNEAQGVIWSYHIILYFLVYVLMNAHMLPFFSKIFQPSKLSLACFILDTLMDCNLEKIFMTIMRSFNLHITEINHTLSSYNNSQWAHHVAYWAAEWSVHGREALIMEGKHSSWKRIEGFDIWWKQSLPSKNLSWLKGPIYFFSATFSPISPRYQDVIQNTVQIQQSTSISRLLFSFPLNQSFRFQTFLEDRSKSKLSWAEWCKVYRVCYCSGIHVLARFSLAYFMNMIEILYSKIGLWGLSFRVFLSFQSVSCALEVLTMLLPYYQLFFIYFIFVQNSLFHCLNCIFYGCVYQFKSVSGLSSFSIQHSHVFDHFPILKQSIFYWKGFGDSSISVFCISVIRR